ncbi:MAG TPA: AraC family transcriptional regulator [Thermoanaerobaculia bacterium]|jgi:AraC-like DNA-binding protein
MTDVLINPMAAELGRTNALLRGSGRHYSVRFDGPLSVKSVLAGSATWETDAGRYEVVPGAALVLADGEEYALEIDALRPVETFCLFFARGFVEDARHAATSGSAALLDADAAPRYEVAERLHFDTPLAVVIRAAQARLAAGLPLEPSFYDAALAIAGAQDDLAARASRLPALRASTREELAHRVARGTAFLHASLASDVSVADAARAACLSPFHFHRLFAALHGTTPHRYLTRLRLDHARALLRATERSVSDVAAACGFASTGSFTTLFTRAFGLPPARFRRNGEVPREPPALRSPHE